MNRTYTPDLAPEVLDRLDAYALRAQRAITIPLLKAMLEAG